MTALLAAEGLSVLLAEQNAAWALSQAGRAVILDVGRVRMTGDAGSLIHDEDVRRAYPASGNKLRLPTPCTAIGNLLSVGASSFSAERLGLAAMSAPD